MQDEHKLVHVSGGTTLACRWVRLEAALLEDAHRAEVVPCHVGVERAFRHDAQERAERSRRDAFSPMLLADPVADEADAILGWKLSELCFNGPQEALTETKVCQPRNLRFERTGQPTTVCSTADVCGA